MQRQESLRPVRDRARKGWPLTGQCWPPGVAVGVGYYGVAVLDELSERYGGLLSGSYDCVDRIVLNAYFSLGHNPGGFRVWWRRLHGDSDEELDNTHLMRMAGRFARRVRAWATACQVPVIDCKRGERKHQLAEEYLATHTVGRGVFLILVARASAGVWEVTRSSSGVIVNLAKKMAFVNHYSCHIMDPEWGHVTIKMSGHPPFAAQVILNGHEYVAAAARAAGIGFTKQGNCFTAVADPAGLARVADTLSQQAAIGRLSQVCDRWISSACLCFGLDLDEQTRSGFTYGYSVYQAEYSRNLLFKVGAQMDKVFDRIVDRTRSRLDVPTLRTLFGAKQRPGRNGSSELSLQLAAMIDTSVRPDPVQSPFRAVDIEGLYQRRIRAALRSDHPQHQATTLRPRTREIPRDHEPARRHGGALHYHPGLRRCGLPAREHPR